MMNKLRNFMYGRYGADQLSYFLLVLYLLLWFISLFTKNYVRFGLMIVHDVIIIFDIYRMLSKNYYQRRKENDFYLSKTSGIRKIIKRKHNQFKYRKEYKYFKCPVCKQYSRVPRGKGSITINCPHCHNQFDGKS